MSEHSLSFRRFQSRILGASAAAAVDLGYVSGSVFGIMVGPID
jgi:hypothetical protein